MFLAFARKCETNNWLVLRHCPHLAPPRRQKQRARLLNKRNTWHSHGNVCYYLVAIQIYLFRSFLPTHVTTLAENQSLSNHSNVEQCWHTYKIEPGHICSACNRCGYTPANCPQFAGRPGLLNPVRLLCYTLFIILTNFAQGARWTTYLPTPNGPTVELSKSLWRPLTSPGLDLC